MALSRTQLAKAGFTELSEALECLDSVVAVTGAQPELILSAVSSSADPDRAITWLVRLGQTQPALVVLKKILKKELVASPGHQPGLLPEWLAEQGVALVIAGGMGSRAQSLFQQNRIGVIVGVMESDPENAVLKYLNGQLDTADNICDH